MRKPLDIICLGRVAVDFYADQIGSRLEDVGSFTKYLGGSSGNIAVGTARMNLKSSMLSRVGDEHMGRFVQEALIKEGVDVSHLTTDPERLTGLVILGIKDKETFPLIFYRENCADMAISEDDIDESYIASSKALLITGTHLSTEKVLRASMKALKYARANDTLTCLDIDYRPVLWGLTGKGEGEERFVDDREVSEKLQAILPEFDLIVGTEEEIHIAGGTTNTIEALNKIRSLTNATLVVKRGPLGACVIDSMVPISLDDAVNDQGVQVEVLNVLGAGDAFISGFLKGWLNNEPFKNCLKYANACGALVVSRHGCCPAMPTWIELTDYLNRKEQIKHPNKDVTLNHLHRVTSPKPDWGSLCILAFDHRKQFEEMAQESGTSIERIKPLKALLVQAFQETVLKLGLDKKDQGVLIDDIYGQDSLNTVTGQNVWIGRPVEKPGSRPLEFDYGFDDIGSHLKSWPKEHIVKCLVFYHPEDKNELRLQQESKVETLYNACCVSGHQLLIELIPPADIESDEFTIFRALERFYRIGIFPDWWKIAPQTDQGWQSISQLINEKAPFCNGIVMLGLDKPIEELQAGFKVAKKYPIVKGFAVGRSIFGHSSRQWLCNKIDDDTFIDQVSENYQQLIRSWQNA